MDVRALLLKPAAAGALTGILFLSAGLFSIFVFNARSSAASSVCDTLPANAAIFTSATTSQGHGSALSVSAVTETVTASQVMTAAVSDATAAVPSDSSSPTDSPTDTTSATPTDSGTATPSTSSPDTSATSSATSTDTSSSASPSSASPSSTSTDSSSPTPSPSPSSSPTSPPTPQLCVEVQSFPSVADVTAGSSAEFVVWVWSTGATSSTVSVTASVPAASYLGSPSFTICPSASGATCSLGDLPVGQLYELLASVPVGSSAVAGSTVALTAQASSTAALAFSASATDVVAQAAAATTTIPPSVTPPLLPLPAIPGTAVTPVNPSSLFPTVSPSPGDGSFPLPPAKSAPVLHATSVSATVPIDPRLIGAQLAGLAVLAGAVTIAVARLSLRRTQPTGPRGATNPGAGAPSQQPSEQQ